MSDSFGDEFHYYASRRSSVGDEYADEENLLIEVLGDEAETLKQHVQIAKKKWSRKTQDWIRQQTKLKLTYDGNSESIPVEVSDGLPPPFAKVVKENDDKRYWEMVLNRPVLETTLQGLNLIEGRVEDLKEKLRAFYDQRRSTKRLDKVSEQTFSDASYFVGELLKYLGKSKAIQRLSSIPVDVLGAYFFRIPRIQLYWLPIAVIAKVLGVSVDSLTAVVLLHEQAHAYTHNGFDTDGEQWDTSDFGKAELRIVEGLAQYYTRTACIRAEDKRPDLLQAYRRLLKHQSHAYRVQKNWHPERPRAGEVIRNTLILTRAESITDYEGFIQTLKSSWKKQGQWDGFNLGSESN